MGINTVLCCSRTTDPHGDLCGSTDCGITMVSGDTTDREHPIHMALSCNISHSITMAPDCSSSWDPDMALDGNMDLDITMALVTGHSHTYGSCQEQNPQHRMISDGGPDQGHPGLPWYLRPGISARLSTATGRQTSTRTLDFNMACGTRLRIPTWPPGAA